MALTQCRECKKQVSTEAVSCPHCGVPRPAQRPFNNTPYIIAALLVAAFGGLSFVLNEVDGTAERETAGRSAIPPEPVAPAPAPAPKPRSLFSEYDNLKSLQATPVAPATLTPPQARLKIEDREAFIYGLRQAGDMSRAQAEASLRNMEAAMRDPPRRRLMECMGVRVWEIPPGGWTAPTSAECRTVAARLGVPYVFEPLK